MKYNRKEFNQLVFTSGWVYLLEGEKQVSLDGEFSQERLEAILWAMSCMPQWLQPDDITDK